MYHDHTPKIVQTGVGNFFDNLGYPTTIVNQFLQGKFKEGAQDTGRFLLNTTLGWGGVIDVASGGTNLPKHNEDSGQTLGWWGVPPGPFLMLPFLGPATVRDAPARIADDFSQPFRWYNAGRSAGFSLGLSLLDRRAQFLPLDKTLAADVRPLCVRPQRLPAAPAVHGVRRQSAAKQDVRRRRGLGRGSAEGKRGAGRG